MSPILFGDDLWYGTSDDVSFQSLATSILEQSSILAQHYKKKLQNNPGLIRTPTCQFNRYELSKINFEEKIEALQNIAVSTALFAIQETQSDTLLAGTIGPYNGRDRNIREAELQRYFSEPAIYLTDRGVHTLLLEGFTDSGQLKKAILSLRKINSVPIPLAAFYRISSQTKSTTISDLIKYSDQIGIELIGFEVDLEELINLPACLNNRQTPLGFQLMNRGNISNLDLEQICEKLVSFSPTLILGGKGLKEEDWIKCKSCLSKQVDKNSFNK